MVKWQKNEKWPFNVYNYLSWTIMGCFSQLPWRPIASRVFPPFHIQVTIILANIKKSISFSARFEHKNMESQRQSPPPGATPVLGQYWFLISFANLCFMHFPSCQPYLLSNIDNYIMLCDSYNTVSSFFS